MVEQASTRARVRISRVRRRDWRDWRDWLARKERNEEGEDGEGARQGEAEGPCRLVGGEGKRQDEKREESGERREERGEDKIGEEIKGKEGATLTLALACTLIKRASSARGPAGAFGLFLNGRLGLGGLDVGHCY